MAVFLACSFISVYQLKINLSCKHNDNNDNNKNISNYNNKKDGIPSVFLIIIVTNVFRWEDVELPNGEEVSEAGSGEYKHLGVVELDIIICRKVKKSKRIILKNNIFTDEK